MKALLRILFILLPFLWSVMALAQPEKDRDCSTTCFSTEVVRAEKISENCTAFEWKIFWSGDCTHALSHFSVEIPCGEVTGLSNSEGWKQEAGTDPTTGLSGFKIDDISEFGETSLNAFTVSFTLCSDSEACASSLDCWQPVVAYKAGGCVNFQTLEIACQQLKASLQETDVSCFGAQDGALSVVIEEATEPVSFLWSDGQTGPVITNLGAGTYQVLITDGSGAELSLEAEIEEPAEIAVSAEIASSSCSGVADGAIDISVSGGNGAYTYLWSNNAITQDLTDLVPGEYKVRVTDESGCSVEKNFIVAAETQMILSVIQTSPLCAAADGALDISVTGGTEPYVFAWSTGAGTEDIGDLSAGVYDVIVTDSRGCSIRRYFNLTPQSPLTLSITATQTDCNAATGSIGLTVTGGTEPYIYVWSNGSNEEDLSGLDAGQYSVTVTDANGCEDTERITVTEKSFMISGTVQNTACSDSADGSITLNDPVGGQDPYTYEWSTGATGNSIDGLDAGIYSVIVTDAGGCTSEQVFLISNPAPISAAVSISNSGCNAEGSYFIDLQISGGTGPYTFVWSDGAETEDRELMTSGTYTVVVTDANGCSVETVVVVEAATETWSCSIESLEAVPVCGSAGNVLSTAVTDADQYFWSVESSDLAWSIEAGAEGSSILFTAGGEGSSATFTLTITKDGCEQTCSYAIASCAGNDSGEDSDDPGGDPDDGDSGDEQCPECFSSALRLVAAENACFTYEAEVSTDGHCRYDLSHWSMAVPCGTIGQTWNSEGWSMEIGTDPTTGISGLKVDGIDSFGKTEDTFMVRFTVCYAASCDVEAWEPVVAYKAGQCVAYQTLTVDGSPDFSASVVAYPNPFRDQITFEWMGTGDHDTLLEIIDQFGHPVDVIFNDKVTKGTWYKVAWSGLGLNTGIYYYRLTGGGDAVYGKVFRQ